MRHILLRVIALIVVGSLGAPVSHATEPLLRRTPGSWFWGPVELHTSASTTTAIYFSVSEPLPAGKLMSARFSYQMTSDSGACKLRPVVRFSGDGITWDDFKEVNATYADDDGEIIPGSGEPVGLFNLAGATAKAWIQFGFETKPESNAFAFCRGTLRVEPQQQG